MKTIFDGYSDAVFKKLDSIERRIISIESSGRNTDQDEIFTVSEVADFLDLAKQTVYQLVSRKAIPSFKRFGRRYFSRHEIEAWLMSSRHISTDEADQLIDRQITQINKSRRENNQ